MPVRRTAAAPRYFGVTPPLAVFALAAASLALGIVLLLAGHLVAGALLLAAAALFGAFFVAAVRRLPDTLVARLSARALTQVRDRAGYAVEAVGAHSSARVELFRLRRELSELVAQRAEAARLLGEAVYGGTDEEAEQARNRMREADQAVVAKEAEMTSVAAAANERIQRAQLQVQPTAVVEPPQIPESPQTPETPQPVTVPDPNPAPSEPLIPPAPDPTPEPTPPPRPEHPPQSPG